MLPGHKEDGPPTDGVRPAMSYELSWGGVYLAALLSSAPAVNPTRL